MSDTTATGIDGTEGVDLTGVSVFVGGPIQHAIHQNGFHQPLRHAIRDIIDAVSAAHGTVFSAHVAERFGADTKLFSPEQVSVRDFDWMRRCDVFVPVLPVDKAGELMRTDGTHVELGWASALGRPVVVVTPTPLAPNASHLLRGLPSIGDVTVFDLAEAQANPAELLRLLDKLGREVVMSE
ncbi:nucleoside 2-deoxyribosyltransferase [Streptomyces coffeae]|uniref:Nucleoside 2-deoxyribosyltransferase n=1 Tax=Streptomyces coffeae TaxID=621382 RepID=A0ABS1NGX8_9ACTN|nr:nucleoside 2-deoxyribosyltransferase [Streptomyces coffeae]MBL1099187.1 nucleoside 2-deoxyribosyltransferase [Streptomyces coffeae]